jgi:hypothetical protein
VADSIGVCTRATLSGSTAVLLSPTTDFILALHALTFFSSITKRTLFDRVIYTLEIDIALRLV